ncbi:MAG TPA: adenylate kinase [Jatrophihabitans sp.]|nr:adenylate kinase [Jatrophihabitans sp.]
MRLVLIGAPGSGKGTQAQLLADASGARHIATGDLLRAEVERDTELGRQVAHLLDSGALVPDQTLLDLVLPLVRADQPAHYILDGFPRSRPQAVRFDELAGPAAPERAVLLEVPRDELVRRLLHRAGEQHRSDDTEDVIVHRLQVFDTQTSPLIEHYRADGRLAVLPAGGAVPEVAAELARLLAG